MSTIEETLGIQKLRDGFLRNTRAAFAKLPALERPRVLDIGCGPGTATVELARMTDGPITGIDIDTKALDELRGKLEDQSLTERTTIIERSFLDSNLPAESFDLLWDEGALHLLDSTACLTECFRLLVPGGYLVSCETLLWHAKVERILESLGFEVFERCPWEPGSWWSDYYAPLERSVLRLREELKATGADTEPLRRYEQEIEAVKSDVSATDCAHVILQKPAGM